MASNPKFEVPNALELFKNLKNPKGGWQLKTPMQKWCHLYGIGKVSFRTLRLPVFNDINHVHWFAYFFYPYSIGTSMLSLYSLYYYACKGELQMGLPSTCMPFVFLGHSPTSIVVFFNKRFKLQSMIDFGGRYIYHDSHKKTEYNRICSDHMDKTMKSFIAKMVAILISYLFAMIGPAHAYFIDGIRSTTIEVRIPFTEPKGNAEFIGNFALQSIVGSHGLLLYIGMETFLSILENVVTITPRLIESDFVHTIQLYEKKSITEIELNVKIGNIVKQSSDADNYVDSLSKIFYWRNFFTPVAFAYLIAMATFCQYTMSFAAGYGMACMTWIQLFYVCEVGENIQDNGFTTMLYQNKWEVLSPKFQKVIMLLIHRKQNERGLSLGPFGMGINRESFKIVCKHSISSFFNFTIAIYKLVGTTNKIYTFVMFLLNSFE